MCVLAIQCSHMSNLFRCMGNSKNALLMVKHRDFIEGDMRVIEFGWMVLVNRICTQAICLRVVHRTGLAG